MPTHDISPEKMNKRIAALMWTFGILFAFLLHVLAEVMAIAPQYIGAQIAY